LNLVLFANACEQIAIIARILRQPQGNPFLMGVGGSGRRSLARLANYIQGYELFQVELTKNYGMKSWRDDLKKLLMWCGVEEKPHSFLFSDSQITNETMLENINQLINSGDVTGIYGEPEMQQIMEACKNECTKRNIVPNKMNVY
jgi:dynein heavy chain